MKKFILFIVIFTVGLNYVNAESLDCKKTLTKGNKGENIETLQRRLNKVMGCELEVDGKYGNATNACVKKFQLQYNLDATGTLDQKTCRKLTSKLDLSKKEKVLSVKGTSLIITENTVRIRKSPSENSKAKRIASLGEIYTYSAIKIKNGTNWYKVKLDEGYGYVQDNYIAKNFIVVDISQQKLILYKNRKVILNTKVITGTYDKHDTPIGSYILEKKNLVPGKTLRGYKPDGSLDYASYVNYWMPFIMDRGIGFHDADWRTEEEYNNIRYLYDGSHGCINMQKEAAKKLFNNITEDIDVIIRD